MAISDSHHQNFERPISGPIVVDGDATENDHDRTDNIGPVIVIRESKNDDIEYKMYDQSGEDNEHGQLRLKSTHQSSL